MYKFSVSKLMIIKKKKRKKKKPTYLLQKKKNPKKTVTELLFRPGIESRVHSNCDTHIETDE